jgi:hypothetical protein
MKTISLRQIMLLGCVLGAACVIDASAQDTTNDTTTSSSDSGNHWGFHHHHDSVLTPDEWAELKKDREQVLSANPDLKSQGEDLRNQRKSIKDATPDDKQAFFSKWRDYQDQVDAAIIQIDANAAPLIAKLKAAFQQRHHHDDDSDSSSNSTSSTNSGN